MFKLTEMLMCVCVCGGGGWLVHSPTILLMEEPYFDHI